MNSLSEDLENLSFDEDLRLDPEDDYSEYLKVLSVDVGVQHLGLSLALLHKEDYTIERIVDTNLIDITKYTHRVCPHEDCELYHTKTFYDWLSHVFIEHPCFEEADVILVERQPPVGASFVVVEQIIFGRFREKTWLINPRSVHSHFNIGHYDYDGRKKISEKIANVKLSERQKKDMDLYDRKHDVADSMCQMMYWSDKRNYEYRLKEQQKLASNGISYLDSFVYIPRV
jgi:hypothetical protein